MGKSQGRRAKVAGFLCLSFLQIAGRKVGRVHGPHMLLSLLLYLVSGIGWFGWREGEGWVRLSRVWEVWKKLPMRYGKHLCLLSA